MIQAASDAELERLWTELKEKLAQDGLDGLEEKVTQAFAKELKKYHDEGLLTQIPMPEV